MNADVQKAVEAADQACATYRLGFAGRRHWQTIRQHLRDQEAEIARLQDALRRYVTATARYHGNEHDLSNVRQYAEAKGFAEGVLADYTAHLGGEHE